ncbi:MAG: hypothetical protein ABL970_02720 [Nitrospira sp.]
MQPNGTDILSAAIEQRIRELVDRERILTFTALATKLPDCRWINLLRALNRLEKEHVIQVIPLPWDYQICALTSASTAPGGG